MPINLDFVGPYNGFPRDLVDEDVNAGALRNGQRSRASAISAVEQAAQYLAAGRSLNIPALVRPMTVSSSTVIPLGRVPVEVFRDRMAFAGFASCDDVGGGVSITIKILGLSPDLIQGVEVAGSVDDTIEDAVEFFVNATQDEFLIGTGGSLDDVPGTVDLEMTIAPISPATSVTIWSLTPILLPQTLLP